MRASWIPNERAPHRLEVVVRWRGTGLIPPGQRYPQVQLQSVIVDDNTTTVSSSITSPILVQIAYTLTVVVVVGEKILCG